MWGRRRAPATNWAGRCGRGARRSRGIGGGFRRTAYPPNLASTGLYAQGRRRWQRRLGHARGDRLPDGEGSCRGRARCVEYMKGVIPLDEQEVADQRAVGKHRLGPDARAAGKEVILTQLRNQALQAARETGLAERARHFRPRLERVPPEKAPEPKKCERLYRVACVHYAHAVALASEREHRVRPALDTPCHHPSEMQSEERKKRVWNRIDEVPNEKPPLWSQHEVLSTKWHDDAGARLPCQGCDAVGVESGTVNDKVAVHLVVASTHVPASARARQLADQRIGTHVGAGCHKQGVEGRDHGGIVRDTFLGNPDGGHA